MGKLVAVCMYVLLGYCMFVCTVRLLYTWMLGCCMHVCTAPLLHVCMYYSVAVWMNVLFGCRMHVRVRLLYACMYCSVAAYLYVLFGCCVHVCTGLLRACMCRVAACMYVLFRCYMLIRTIRLLYGCSARCCMHVCSARLLYACMYCPVAVCMYVLLGCCMHVCIARLLYACTCMFCSVSIGLFALFGYCRQCMCHLCVSVSYHQLNKRGSVITYSPHRKVQSPEVLSVKVQSLEIKVLIRKVVQRDPS